MRCLVALLLALHALPVTGKELKQIESRLRLEYTDGSVERYVVRWTGTVLTDRQETGGPAMPLQGKWTDDRRCHWIVRAVVSRQVFLTSRNGEEYERTESRKLFESTKDASGADLRLETLRSENCNDAEPKIQSDIREARSKALAALDQVVAEDRLTVQVRFREMQGVRKAEFEPAPDTR